MIVPRSSIVGALSVALLLPLPGTAQEEEGRASQGRGTVEGVVYDSIRGEPLDDARVVLWETTFQTTTDSSGHFQIDDVPAGRYQVVFYHPRIIRQGVSTGSRSVDVLEDESSPVRLSTPSMATIQISQCLMEGQIEEEGTAVGRVQDPATGVALPRAKVILTWREPDDDGAKEVSAFTDSQGWYRHCSVPLDRIVGARAEFLDRSGPRKEFLLDGEDAARVDFHVSRLLPAAVSGRVTDTGNQKAVADAEVTLLGTSHRRVTNDDGRFRFEEVPPGTYTVEVRHLAYGTRTDTVQVGTGLAVNLEIPVSMQPVALDPIHVTVEAQPLGSEFLMGGEVIEPAAVDEVRHRSRDAFDIIRSQHVSGLLTRRQGNELCVGFTPGQTRMYRNDCHPAVVFIDNVRATAPTVAMNLPAESIDRVVLYRPLEAGNLFGMGSGSGVIMIFTRSADIPRN